MSLEIVLLPLAVAAVSAVKAKRSARTPDHQVAAEDLAQVQPIALVEVSTRMRDIELLGLALGDTGASVQRREDLLLATWDHRRCVFARDTDGIWSAHFPDDVELEQAAVLIRAVDTAYGLRVQRALVERLRERAPEAGMTVESETVEVDATVTLVLNVERVGT